MSSPKGAEDAARLAVAQCIICKIENGSTHLIPGERDYAMLAEVASVSNLINPIEETDPRKLVLCRDCGTMCKERAAKSALNTASNRQQAPTKPSNIVPECLPDLESIKSSPASERNDSPLPPFATLFSPHCNVQYNLPVESTDVEMLAAYDSVNQKLPAPEDQEQYGEPMEPLAGLETLLSGELGEYQGQQDEAMEHSGCAEVQQPANDPEPVVPGEPDEPPYPTAPTPAYTFADFPRAEERAAKRREAHQQLLQQLEKEERLVEKINEQQQQLLDKQQQQHPQSSGSLSAETENTVAETEAGPSGLVSADPTHTGAPEQANLPAVQTEPLDYSIQRWLHEQQQHQPKQLQHLQQEKHQANQLIEELFQQELKLLRKRRRQRRRQRRFQKKQKSQQQESQQQKSPQQEHQLQQHQHSRSDRADATDDGTRCLASQGVLPTIGTLEQRKDPDVHTTPVDYSIGQQEEEEQQQSHVQLFQYIMKLHQHQQSSPGPSQQEEQQQQIQQQQQKQQHQQLQQHQQFSGNLSMAKGHKEAGRRSTDSAGTSLDGVPTAGAPDHRNLPANQSANLMDYTIRQQQQSSSSGSNVASMNNHAASQLYMYPRGQLLIPKKCDRCNTVFKDFFQYRSHLNDSHDRVQCLICKLEFNVFLFEQHMDECFGNANFCLACHRAFKPRPKPNPKPISVKEQCYVCKKYYVKNYVAQHIKKLHPSVK